VKKSVYIRLHWWNLRNTE